MCVGGGGVVNVEGGYMCVCVEGGECGGVHAPWN